MAPTDQARHAIRWMLDGNPPNGIGPEDCGPFADDVRGIYAAYTRGGTVEARRHFTVRCKFKPALMGLMAMDRTPDDQSLLVADQEAHAPNSDELQEVVRFPEGTAVHACDWLDRYIAFSEQWSPRSYGHFHEAVGIWVLSTLAARRVILHFGNPRTASLYIALTARSSVFAKTTAARLGVDLLRDAGLGYLLAPDEATPQSFVHMLAGQVPDDYDDMDPRQQQEVLLRLAFAAQRGWFYEEFGQKIRAMMREGNVMADFRGLLRRFDDGHPSYESLTLGRGSDRVERPYLALLANMTPADLRPHARHGSALWNDGFWARFAFITPPTGVKPSLARFPKGKRIFPSELLGPLAAWHQRLGIPKVTLVEQVGPDGKPHGRYRADITPLPQVECTLASEVEEAFYTYHDTLSTKAFAAANEDLDGNYTRFAEKALRCAMLFASLENDGRIELRHWARAQQVAERWRQDLHHLVAQLQETQPSAQQSLEEKVLDQLGRSPSPLTARELVQRIRGLTTYMVPNVLDCLVTTGQVTEMKAEKTMRYRLSKTSGDV